MKKIDVEKNIQLLRKAMEDKKDSTLLHALGIQIDHISLEYMSGTMPVDQRTHQYYGMLHGGASVAFAESLCSMGAFLFIDGDTHYCVGLEINANHVRSMTSGYVKGVARPVHVGKRTQIWQIEIKNETGDLVCTSRCTMAVVEKK
jgi:1,4-dihydroxy-2-naphthoyl-CoA hydrolase